MGQCVRGNSVEGQGASRAVYIYRHSFRGWGERDYFFSIVVPDRVTTVCALQTPRLMIPSKPTHSIVSSPVSPVSDPNGNPSPPLNFPIATSCHTIPAQQLMAGESLWMIRIWLLFLHGGHLSVVVGQFEVSVCCVWIQLQFTGI